MAISATGISFARTPNQMADGVYLSQIQEPQVPCQVLY